MSAIAGTNDVNGISWMCSDQPPPPLSWEPYQDNWVVCTAFGRSTLNLFEEDTDTFDLRIVSDDRSVAINGWQTRQHDSIVITFIWHHKMWPVTISIYYTDRFVLLWWQKLVDELHARATLNDEMDTFHYLCKITYYMKKKKKRKKIVNFTISHQILKVHL